MFIYTILNSICDINNYRNLFIFSNSLTFNKVGNKLIDADLNINAANKFDILDKEKFLFKPHTLLFGDAEHDLYMSRKMGS